MNRYPQMPVRLLTAFALLTFSILCQAGDVTVYAAASLTNVLTELTRTYEASGTTKIKTSFAASGTLAKQIESGAPADLFISADNKWMDYLSRKGKIDRDSRINLLGNSLALIAPKGKGFSVRFEKGFAFAKAFKGKVCTGETETVPVGIYAREALINLGWWDEIKSRLIGTDDVRTALDLVGRGECPGIVYGTDAKASDKVEVLGVFPENLHAPIVYPAALVKQSDEGRLFLNYLRESGAVFARHGFKILK